MLHMTSLTPYNLEHVMLSQVLAFGLRKRMSRLESTRLRMWHEETSIF